MILVSRYSILTGVNWPQHGCPCYKPRLYVSVNLFSWSMATILCDSVAIVVMWTCPWAISMAMITMRKSIHGFPLLSYINILRNQHQNLILMHFFFVCWFHGNNWAVETIIWWKLCSSRKGQVRFQTLAGWGDCIALVYNLCSLARNCFSHCMFLLGEWICIVVKWVSIDPLQRGWGGGSTTQF